MRKTILFTALLLSASLWGQSTFHKRYTGALLQSIYPEPGGGAIATGNFGTSSNERGLLARIGNDGENIWSLRFPTLNWLRYAIPADGGYVIMGDTLRPPGPGYRPRYHVVTKINQNGSPEWSRIFGNATSASIPNQLIYTPTGYVVSGSNLEGLSTSEKAYFCKLDGNGNLIWSKKYTTGNANFNARLFPQHLEGDTIYACGHIQGNAAVMRVNVQTGEMIGLTSFGGIYFEELTSLRPTQDGNFIVAGSTRSTSGSEYDYPLVAKINRQGAVVWAKVYSIPNVNLTARLEESESDGYVLTFALGSQGVSTYYSIIAKINQKGELQWANNYTNELTQSLHSLIRSTDGHYIAASQRSILKVDEDGWVANNCCPAPVSLQVEDYSPPYQYPVLMTEDWDAGKPFVMQTAVSVNLTTSEFCTAPLSSVVEQIGLCQGDSVQINGVYYQAPNTILDTVVNLSGGCDTLRVYQLVALPEPFQTQTVRLCPGSSVVVNGIVYTQPGTNFSTLASETGCDTLLVTFIQMGTQPTIYQTTTFCPGDTVFVNGVGYSVPTIFSIPDTLVSAGPGCDTLLYRILDYPQEPSSVSITCPANIKLSTATATPIVVHFDLPVAMSDCSCPAANFSLSQGLPSGSVFPVGSTQVCYTASDICGASQNCCFEVQVVEEEACDVKTNGCITYELLGISNAGSQDKTYRIRVSNACASPLAYVAFQLPNGIAAVSPAANSTYQSNNGREYLVRNPNHSPFHSVRFAAVNTGVSNGQSDVFEYTLPAQSSPLFIRAVARLASGALYEATLNTFGCGISNSVAERTMSQPDASPSLRVFPNPNSGELFFECSAWKSEMAQLRVLNAQGQEIAQTSRPTNEGIQTFLLPNSLPDGLYFLEMKSETGERQIAKFVLRH